MDIELTSATRRVFHEASLWILDGSGSLLQAPVVLLALLHEPECRAAMFLSRSGIDAATIQARWPGLSFVDEPRDTESAFSFNECEISELVPRFSPEMTASVAIACQQLADLPQPLMLATEHLLLGLAAADHEVAKWLAEQGFRAEALRDEILRQFGVDPEPLDLDDSPLPCNAPAETAKEPEIPVKQEVTPVHPSDSLEPEVAIHAGATWEANVVRLLDASTNRAREALRVIEDYVRFVLDDAHLTKRMKTLRHELTATLAVIPMPDRLAMRETQTDVGTSVSTAAELSRSDATDVLTANFTRLQEALRSLEEFGKIHKPEISQAIERLRYDSYTLQKASCGTIESRSRLSGVLLYVLVDAGQSVDTFEKLVSTLVGAGVGAIQLRDKRADDRVLLDRARRLRGLTQLSRTLFVMNDRPDLAVLANADGVHVGQEELTVRDVRQVVGPRMLVGVSTHNIEQARQAVLDGASYLGVGPTFPSGTKVFDEFPGLQFARQAAAEIRLPAFAIGGIDSTNLVQVLDAGIGRVAVSGAVARANNPAAAAEQLLAQLRAGRR